MKMIVLFHRMLDLAANQDETEMTSPSAGSSGSKFPLTKIETLKSWGVSTYKCTRQLMFEKLGKTSRTVDKGQKLRTVNVLNLRLNAFNGKIQFRFGDAN